MLTKFNNAGHATTTASPYISNQNEFEEVPVIVGAVLTGGGSHGAFEAGVLATIAKKLKFSVMVGTSAGALNAVTFGSGLNASGTDEAIKRSQQAWSIVKANGGFFGRHMRFFSDIFLPPNRKWPNLPFTPYNPMEMFKAYTPSVTAQFISATARNVVKDWQSEVQNGPVKIYINTVLEKRGSPGEFEHVILSGRDLTSDGVGASANLKQLGVHSIEDTDNLAHKGRKAYDGAYKENGPLAPLIENNVTDCIMIILHDRRHNVLDKAGDLKHAEIHSHALEMAACDSHFPIRLHAIEIESLGGEIGGLTHMDDSSKLNADPEFINMLYDAGVKAGEAWLAKNFDHIGQRQTYTFYPPALEQFASACPA